MKWGKYMNRYLMQIEHYFCGTEEFEVSATDKEDAVFVAKQYVERNPKYSGGNYKMSSICVVKKLNTKKGINNE